MPLCFWTSAFTEQTKIRRENLKSAIACECKQGLCSGDNEPLQKLLFADHLAKK